MRDFVVFLSRFLEKRTWDKESLDLLARHYETNELISNNLFDKMIKTRNFHSAAQLMGQLQIMHLIQSIFFLVYKEKLLNY